MNGLGGLKLYDRMFWGLMVLAAILLFIRLGAAPIYILDEAKNAQCAREMWHNGNWVVPTFNGELRTDKPALHYWFMGISYSIAGVGPAQARFFSVIMGLATLFITFWQVRRWENSVTAFFSTLVLVASPHFLFEFRLSVPDPYLIFFTTAGLFFGFGYLEKGSRTALMFCALSLGVAMLAKGPVALVLPGLAFLIFMVIQKNWHPLKDPFVLIALVMAIGIAFPWYWAVHQETEGAFTRGFFFDHNLNRFSSQKEGHGGPFIITPLIVMIGLLPFSLLIIESFKRKFGFLQNPLFRFSAIVVIVYIAFFSISSTKLPNYPMPCYPFAAVMAGFALTSLFKGENALPKYLWWIWLPLSFLIPVAAYVGLRLEVAVAHLAWIAFLLIVLPIGTLWAYFRKREDTGLFILAASWILFSAIFLWVGYPLIYKENPVTKMNPLLGEGENVVAFRSYNPAFNFNFRDDAFVMPVFTDTSDLKKLGLQQNQFTRKSGVYLITRLEYLDELTPLGWKEVARHRDLFELPTTILLHFGP